MCWKWYQKYPKKSQYNSENLSNQPRDLGKNSPFWASVGREWRHAGSKKKEKICFALLTDYLRSFSNIPSNSVDACMHANTDNGHPERAFFQKFETFWHGQTNWAEIVGGILAISSQTVGSILALWVPCSWESVAGSFSYKKRWFLGLKHTTPKYSQKKILAVKNFEKSLCTSVFGVSNRYSLEATEIKNIILINNEIIFILIFLISVVIFL